MKKLKPIAAMGQEAMAITAQPKPQELLYRTYLGVE